MNLFPLGFKVSLIKRVDSLIGKQILQLLSVPVASSGIKVRSILLIRPGGIGDALLLAPAINSLRANYPDAFITILAERRNSGAFCLIPAVNQVLLYDRITDLIRLLSSKFDLIIDTEQWHRMSAVIARLVPSLDKIGFDTNERRRLFTHKVPYSQPDYEAQSFLNLLKPIGINNDFDHSSPFLTVSDTALKEIEPYLRLIKAPYVTIFPGASIKERRWGVGKFSSLLHSLADSGISSVIIGGKEDEDAGDAIVTGTAGQNLSGKISIAGTAAIIAGSRVLVSGDSGVLHLGAGLAVPTVSLFGAGIADKWAPKGQIHRVINRDLLCSPCTLFGTTPVCPNDVRCLAEIEVETVYGAVVALFNNWSN